MVYGYINRYKGETEEFLNETKVDRIIYADNPIYNFSFAEKGDLVIIKDFTSVASSLKELLEFAQFIYETEIDIECALENVSSTRSAMGKMMMSTLAALNKYDDATFGNKNIA